MLLTPENALSLAEWIWPAFVREDDLTFVQALRIHTSETISLPTALDIEAFVNHFHILDHLEHDAGLTDEPWWNSSHPDFAQACRLGVMCCESWAAKLRQDFPDDDFAVFCTRDDNPIVRFHRIRSDGALWLDPRNSPELFRSGAALFISSQSGERVGGISVSGS